MLKRYIFILISFLITTSLSLAKENFVYPFKSELNFTPARVIDINGNPLKLNSIDINSEFMYGVKLSDKYFFLNSFSYRKISNNVLSNSPNETQAYVSQFEDQAQYKSSIGLLYNYNPNWMFLTRFEPALSTSSEYDFLDPGFSFLATMMVIKKSKTNLDYSFGFTYVHHQDQKIIVPIITMDYDHSKWKFKAIIPKEINISYMLHPKFRIGMKSWLNSYSYFFNDAPGVNFFCSNPRISSLQVYNGLELQWQIVNSIRFDYSISLPIYDDFISSSYSQLNNHINPKFQYIISCGFKYTVQKPKK